MPKCREEARATIKNHETNKSPYLSGTRSILFAALVFLVAANVQAGISLLHPDGQSATTAGGVGSRAPATDEWIRQSPLPTARNLTGVSWATSTHGLASGEAYTLVETFDAGATWRNVILGTATDPFYNILCRDASSYFVIGNSGTFGPDHFRTTDSGVTWQRITNFPVGGSWYHIDFVSPTVGFMGSNGATVRSTDGGVSWAVMSDYRTCPVMYGMDFRDALVGLCGGTKVATGDDGPGIFKTTDAGVTWVRKFSQSANDVLWLNDTTAIAMVGVSIYRSINSGDTWSLISSQIFTGLDEMTLLPNGTIVGYLPRATPGAAPTAVLIGREHS